MEVLQSLLLRIERGIDGGCLLGGVLFFLRHGIYVLAFDELKTFFFFFF